MNNRLIALCCCIFLLFHPEFALAGTGSGDGQIKLLYVHPSNNWIRVDFTQGIQNPDNCEGSGFYIVELNDSKSSDRFYSAILSAYAAQKTVYFWIAGCSSVAPWGKRRPKIYDIYMK
ncbi:hypothetical protein L2725_12770 [Shewanella corallii]|uniref:Uncharacterized protein n=1 Tax=Shewanella corallii TaxID=560080 RepID=A0ABT0N9W4_9GAMM|nr:hypothetical protein [Shewanella corallii]MCL2914641.1 hypothetical protein [Shewanella corallii]